mgnify:CR=1 FL=1
MQSQVIKCNVKDLVPMDKSDKDGNALLEAKDCDDKIKYLSHEKKAQLSLHIQNEVISYFTNCQQLGSLRSS